MTGYVCTFERIGRNHGVPPLTVESDDADEIAYQVWAYSRRYLASAAFEVVVDLEKLTGSIDYGRFGTFRLEAA